jgi:hypothetical protein
MVIAVYSSTAGCPVCSVPGANDPVLPPVLAAFASHSTAVTKSISIRNGSTTVQNLRVDKQLFMSTSHDSLRIRIAVELAAAAALHYLCAKRAPWSGDWRTDAI